MGGQAKWEAEGLRVVDVVPILQEQFPEAAGYGVEAELRGREERSMIGDSCTPSCCRTQASGPRHPPLSDPGVRAPSSLFFQTTECSPPTGYRSPDTPRELGEPLLPQIQSPGPQPSPPGHKQKQAPPSPLGHPARPTSPSPLHREEYFSPGTSRGSLGPDRGVWLSPRGHGHFIGHGSSERP